MRTEDKEVPHSPLFVEPMDLLQPHVLDPSIASDTAAFFILKYSLPLLFEIPPVTGSLLPSLSLLLAALLNLYLWTSAGALSLGSSLVSPPAFSEQSHPLLWSNYYTQADDTKYVSLAQRLSLSPNSSPLGHLYMLILQAPVTQHFKNGKWKSLLSP